MNPSLNTQSWRQIIPEDERKIFIKSGFSDTLKMGKRPLLLVIDTTFAFTGSKPQSVEASIDEFPTSCGEQAWKAFPKIRALLDFFRENSYPVVYTRCDYLAMTMAGKATKSRGPVPTDPKANEYPEMIAPVENEWILEKPKASAFFSTPLVTYLHNKNVDTLIVCGVSTSGCVRASVVDAFSYGFTTFVIDDACFDRSYYAHCSNLFDMDAKYATVLSTHEVLPLLRTVKN